MFQKTVELARVRTSDRGDAFAKQGWALLVLKMLEVTLMDLTSDNPALRNAAKDWFDPVKGEHAALSFEDCVFVMGQASVIEEIRDKALNRTEEMLRDVKSALQAQARAGEKQEVHAPAVDVETSYALQRAMFAPASPGLSA